MLQKHTINGHDVAHSHLKKVAMNPTGCFYNISKKWILHSLDGTLPHRRHHCTSFNVKIDKIPTCCFYFFFIYFSTV